MTTEELEERLEGGVETQTLEVKSACDWNAQSLAKDILAMSNVRDGGYIIVGVEDNTFIRKGITAAQKATYSLDIMRDQMAPYADPHVDFSVEFPKDSQGREYAVIRVLPFEEVPVICRKDSKDTHAGVVYYRKRNARVSSGPVSSSFDMRDIITTATVRLMQRTVEMGFTVENKASKRDEARKKLDRELGGL